MELIRDKPFAFVITTKQVRLRIPAQMSRTSSRYEGGCFDAGDTVTFEPRTDDAFAVVKADEGATIYAHGGRMFVYVPKDVAEKYRLRQHRN